jgi:hypothetical protein
MQTGPWSVVNSPSAPATGDKHDYTTLSRYWWPNPKTTTGLPYVRRDGKTDPLIANYPDETYLNDMVDTTSTLANAWSLLHTESYAARATTLLTTFFVNPATAMNPNATYGQFIPGVSTPTGEGILDTRVIIRVLDDVTMLRGSAAWSQADNQAMSAWLSSFLIWLTTSPTGRAGQAQANNHGTWYDDEVAAIALFLGRDDIARSILDAYVKDRVEVQIKSNGEQPLELARTNSWDYSTFNLTAAVGVVASARYFGVDLYRCTAASGGSIAKALVYLTPYATGQKQWTRRQSGTFDASEADYPLAAAGRFGDSAASAALAKVAQGEQGSADGIVPLDLAALGHTA